MSVRRLACWILAAMLAWPPHARAQEASQGSTLLIDRGTSTAPTPTGAAPASAASDPFTGSATLALELRVAPGTGGMQPQLGLSYSNQRRADSWVGYGWSLPLGSIRRSLKRGVPRYDDALDRFELDGQDLVPDPAVPGRFQTRRQSFVRIDRLASGGWEVRGKDGSVSRFGTATASRIERSDGKVFEWLLAEREDLRGNGLSVSYDRTDPGTAYPSEVHYTLRRSGAGLVSMGSAAERVVRFQTEARPDPFQSQLQGLLEQQRKRLARVLVQAGGKLVRRYDLVYGVSADSGRSLLKEISERGSDAGVQPQPAVGVSRVTRFGYHSNVDAKTQGWKLAPEWKLPGEFVTTGYQDGGARLADVNGDGLPDFVIAKRVGPPLAEEDALADSATALTPDSGVYLNTGKGFAAAPDPRFRLPRQSFFVSLDKADASPSAPRGSFGTLLMDLSGDGRADLLTAARFFRAASGGGVTPHPVQLYAANTGSGWERQPAGAAGDALLGAGATASISRDSARRENTSGVFDGNLNFAELNGDGLPDVVVAERLGGTGSIADPTQPLAFWGLNRGQHRGFELDTRSPRFIACSEKPRLDATACPGFRPFTVTQFGAVPEKPGKPVVLQNTRTGTRFIDLDSDGLDDQISSYVLMLPGSATRSELRDVFLNTGSGFAQTDAWPVPPLLDETRPFSGYPGITSSIDLGVRMFDINGDGRTDLLRRIRQQGGDLIDIWLNTGFPVPGDKNRPWALQAATSPLQVPRELSFTDAEGHDRGVRPVDVDGNGMVDFMLARGGERQVFLNLGSPPDQLTAMTNPFGGVMRFEYESSARFDNTGEDDRPDLPQVVQVVRSIQTEDSAGAPVRSTMEYADGLYDAVEREFRGFGRVAMRRFDGRTSSMEFHQDLELAGMIERSEVRDAQSQRLEESVFEYTADDAPGEPFARLLQAATSIEYPTPGASGAPRRIRTQLSYERDTRGRFRFGRLSARAELGEVDEGGQDLDPADTRVSEFDYVENEALHLVELVRSERLREASGVLRETRRFYDGDTSGGAVPRRGLLTRQLAVLGESGAADPTTGFEHDEFGNVTVMHSPRELAGEGGGATRYGYDSVFHTFLVSSTNALNHTLRYDYEPGACAGGPPLGSGLRYAEQGPNDSAQSRGIFCYDALGRPTLARGPGGLTEERTGYVDTPRQNSIAREMRATSGGGMRRGATFLDGFGRAVRSSSDGPGQSTIDSQWMFDGAGRMLAEIPAHYADETAPPATRYTYDALDRRIGVEPPGAGRSWTFGFDRGAVTESGPSGRRRRFMDPFGRLIRVEEYLGERALVSRYGYLASGELARFIDADGNETRLQYDRLGRRRSIEDPDTGTTTTRYDAAGNITATSDAGGEVSFKYDTLDRLLERSVSGTVESSRRYDSAPGGIGYAAELRDAIGELSVTAYDALGRPLQGERRAGGPLHRFRTSYDPLGQITGRALPSGRTLVFQMDGRGYPLGVQSGPTALVQDVRFEADGRLRGWTAANGVRTRFGYDSATRRLTSHEIRGSQPLESRQFEHDGADRVLSIADAVDAQRTQRFSYDALDRITSASGPYAPGFARLDLHYAYGNTGNLRCLDATAPVTNGCSGGRELAYPTGGTGVSRPHAPSSVDGKPVRHGARGELLQIGERSYRYDALGQLTSALEAGRELAAFGYDADTSRVKIVEQTGASEIVRYLLSDDFEWNATRGSATTYVRVAGQLVAALGDTYRPGAPQAVADPVATGTAGWLRLFFTALLLAAAAALLAAALADRRMRGLPLRRPLLAGAASWLIAFGGMPASVWAAPLDGDLTRDRRLDMADVMLALRFAFGLEQPSAEQLQSGDVAPLELAPSSPSIIDLGDALLLLRASRGEDVDGDGVSNLDELDAGASPFRADTDRDGMGDAQEIAQGRDPAVDENRTRLAQRARGRTPAGQAADEAADAAVRYFHTDALGSTLITTDAQGQVVSRVLYRPFGQAVSPQADAPAQVQEHGFTGQRFEAALGLYDYRARFYDPALGRFLQADSMIPDPSDPRSFNRYSYVRNDPTHRVDPTGNVDVLSSLGGGTLFSGAADRFGSYSPYELTSLDAAFGSMLNSIRTSSFFAASPLERVRSSFKGSALSGYTATAGGGAPSGSMRSSAMSWATWLGNAASYVGLMLKSDAFELLGALVGNPLGLVTGVYEIARGIARFDGESLMSGLFNVFAASSQIRGGSTSGLGYPGNLPWIPPSSGTRTENASVWHDQQKTMFTSATPQFEWIWRAFRGPGIEPGPYGQVYRVYGTIGFGTAGLIQKYILRMP